MSVCAPQITMHIVEAPAEWVHPVKQDRRLSPSFKVLVKVHHKDRLSMPLTVKAYLATQSDMDAIDAWLPDDWVNEEAEPQPSTEVRPSGALDWRPYEKRQHPSAAPREVQFIWSFGVTAIRHECYLIAGSDITLTHEMLTDFCRCTRVCEVGSGELTTNLACVLQKRFNVLKGSRSITHHFKASSGQDSPTQSLMRPSIPVTAGLSALEPCLLQPNTDDASQFQPSRHVDPQLSSDPAALPLDQVASRTSTTGGMAVMSQGTHQGHPPPLAPLPRAGSTVPNASLLPCGNNLDTNSGHTLTGLAPPGTAPFWRPSLDIGASLESFDPGMHLFENYSPTLR